MQEVRATDEVLRDHLGGDWHLAHAEPAIEGSKGRAGVAVASRRPIKAERAEIGPERFAGSGRWVEADVVLDDGSTLTAVSTYVFTGEFETPPRQAEKYAFLDAITTRLTELRADGRRRPAVRRPQHRPSRGRPEGMEGEPQEERIPARGTRLDGPPVRGRLGRPRPPLRWRGPGSVLLVVLARQGVRQRQPAGGSTTRSPLPSSPIPPPLARSTGPRRTPNAGATTPPSSRRTGSEDHRSRSLWNTAVRRDGGAGSLAACPS